MDAPRGDSCGTTTNNKDIKETNHIDNSCLSLAAGLDWKITWIRAFPTLWIILHDRDDHDHSTCDASATASSTNKGWWWCENDHGDDDQTMNAMLQQIAFDEIFSNHAKHRYHRNNSNLLSQRQPSKEETTDATRETFPPEPPQIHDNKQSPSSTSLITENGDSSLGYGEITESAVFQVISWIRRDLSDKSHGSGKGDDGDKHFWTSKNVSLEEHAKKQEHLTLPAYCHRHRHDSVVLDLGSGNGKVLLASALAFPFTRAIGFEIVKELHDEAMMHLSEWNRRHPLVSSFGNHDDATIVGGTTFEFHHADLRECLNDHNNDTMEWMQHVRLVWVHATVFDDVLMESVQQICEACPTRTYFAMVTKALRTTTTSISSLVQIETRGVLQLPMSWGQATVYIQKKLSS